LFEFAEGSRATIFSIVVDFVDEKASSFNRLQQGKSDIRYLIQSKASGTTAFNGFQ
jgi:hypothetical protein